MIDLKDLDIDVQSALGYSSENIDGHQLRNVITVMAKHVNAALDKPVETKPPAEYLRNVYGPAHQNDWLPEGSTVGASDQFVGFSIGFGPQHLLTPNEADHLARLLKLGADKVRDGFG